MKEHQFRAAKAAIQSLEASTNITMLLNGIMAVGGGRRSPYVSHREWEFAATQEGGHFLAFRNDRYRLAICPDAEAGEAAASWIATDGMETHCLVIPSAMLAALFEQVCQVGLKPTWSVGVVSFIVIAMPRLVGWGEDGSPIYAAATGGTP